MKKIFNSIIMCVMIFLISFIGSACSDSDNDGLNKYPTPMISEFYPTEGYPTSIVTIKGANFGSERTERIGRVYFGGIEATEYVAWSDTEIQVRVPNNAKTGNITLWVWKNNTETTSEYTCIPGAIITDINPNPASPESTITIMGKNFQSFIDKGLVASDVIVEFQSKDEGIITSAGKELTATALKVDVPANAKGGNITVKFGDYQIVSGPELKVEGEFTYRFCHKDVETILGACNPCSYVNPEGANPLIGERDKSNMDTYIFKYKDGYNETTPVGSFVLWDSKVGNYTIFKVDVTVNSVYYVYFSKKGSKGGSITVSAGADKNSFEQNVTKELVGSSVSGSWGIPVEYGPYTLNQGVNYVKINFDEAELALCDIRITNVRELD